MGMREESKEAKGVLAPLPWFCRSRRWLWLLSRTPPPSLGSSHLLPQPRHPWPGVGNTFP